jgi:hypothetical protein
LASQFWNTRSLNVDNSEKLYPVDSDYCTGNKLGLPWQFQAHFTEEFYDLTGNSNKLFAIGNKGKYNLISS